MRPAFLIIAANLAAAGLGSIMTIWLTSMSGPAPAGHDPVAAAKTACPAAAAHPALAVAPPVAKAAPS